MLVILDIQSNIHLILKIANGFEFLPVDVNLGRCQRYFEKSYNIDVAPGTNTFIGLFMFANYTPSNTISPFPCVFQVHKRAAPSISLFTASGTIDRVDIIDTSATTSTTTTANSIGTRSFGGWVAAGTTGGANAFRTAFHFIASAEL